MRARILPIDTDAHRTVQALLPWHANGTLARAESARVDAHLAECARCQADLAAQMRVRETLQRGAARLAAPDTDRGWALLRESLASGDASAPDDDALDRIAPAER